MPVGDSTLNTLHSTRPIHCCNNFVPYLSLNNCFTYPLPPSSTLWWHYNRFDWFLSGVRHGGWIRQCTHCSGSYARNRSLRPECLPPLWCACASYVCGRMCLHLLNPSRKRRRKIVYLYSSSCRRWNSHCGAVWWLFERLANFPVNLTWKYINTAVHCTV